MERPDGRESEPVQLAPAEELCGGLHVGDAGIAVADGRGEEFREVLTGIVAGIRDNCRHGKSPGRKRAGAGRGAYRRSRARTLSLGFWCLLLEPFDVMSNSFRHPGASIRSPDELVDFRSEMDGNRNSSTLRFHTGSGT